jgi:prephenate dehydrogenase
MSRIAVAGLGLIGGSLALAFNAVGFDTDPRVRRRARERGIETADSLEAALADANFVFLAVSSAETPELLAEAVAARPGALFSDCAALKIPVLRAAAMLPESARFVGGHPMAGSATRGFAGADAGLFQGRPWVLVPTARTDEHALAVIGDLVTAIGAVPVVLDADTHDAAMTRLSHLPHVVSAALAVAAAQNTKPVASRLAGPGLLDTTRLAEMPMNILLEMALADPRSLADAIADVTRELGALGEALRNGDLAKVRAFFKRAAAARRNLTST